MIQTVASSEVDVKDYESWNERMFIHYGNDRLYFHPNLIIRKIQAQRIRTIIRFMDVQPLDEVLDAGCGEGYLFSKLPISPRQVGIDLSPTALEIATRRNAGPEWVLGDLQELPFEDGMFDKICCSEVIEHVPHPEQVIKELRRVIKSSGKVVLTVPHERNINWIKDVVLGNFLGRLVFPDIPMRTEWHLTEYTPALLRAQVSNYFIIEQQKTLPLKMFGLGYCISCLPK